MAALSMMEKSELGDPARGNPLLVVKALSRVVSIIIHQHTQTNIVPRIGQARIKKFFDTDGVEWGRSELGFCLLRVGGPKHVVKVYYLKLTKKIPE